MNKSKKIFIITITFLMLACLTVISATNTDSNNTTTITETTQAHSIDTTTQTKQANAINDVTESTKEESLSQTDNIQEINNSKKTVNKKTGVITQNLKASSNTVTVTTFSELRSNLISNTYDDLTINLDGDILLSNSLYANAVIKTLTINGNGHTINGSNSYTFLYLYNPINITLENLNVTWCRSTGAGGAIRAENNNTIRITNCNFTNNWANDNGGAIRAYDNNTVILTNCNFIQNVVLNPDHNGGAMSLSQYNNASIINCTFIDNWAQYGGALHSNNYTNTTVENSNFINNSADNGGAIYIYQWSNLITTNNNFINNVAGFGGAVYAYYLNNITSTKNNYTNNKADIKRGGALYGFVGTSITTVYDNFTNNSAATYGGAILGHNYAKINVTNSSFTDNSAQYGGSISGMEYSEIIIEDTNFINNTASASGGVVYGHKNANINVSHVNFTSNTATDGGALYGYTYVKVTITETNFTGNSAVNGGSISGDSTCTMTITNSNLTNNTAVYGGAIYCTNALTSTNNTFVDNTATYGGSLAVKELTARFVGTDDTYENNNATYGGAVYASIRAIIISNNGTFDSNNATLGGVAYIDGEAKFNTDHDVFENNTATDGGVFYVNCTGRSIEAEGSNYTNNKATEYGGVLYVERGFVDSDDETYINNTALIGGTIYNLAGTVDSINNVLINNSADYGGAAFISENGTLIKQSGTDINNTALIGGAIYNNGTLTSSGSTFEENNATIGGALFNNGKSTITGDTFKNNNATLGGAVYNNAKLNPTSNTFVGNNATNGGGLFDNGTLSGAGNNYYNNTALENGGGVYSCSDNNVVIKEITFEGNVAGQNGGAIYTESNVTINSSHDVKYITNSAVNGGAVYLGNAGDLITSADEFISNNATYGGAVYASANNTLTVKTSTTFDSNNATLGGAIYLNDTAKLNSTRGVYKNGNATQGSAVYAQTGSEIDSSKDTFTSNYADEGAIYLEDDVEAKFTDDIFTSNTATKGAAIYAKSDLNITSNNFAENKAEKGGAIYLNESHLNSDGDNYISNSADKGGAVYLSNDSTLNVTSSTFTSNNATHGGAAYLDENSVVNSTGATYRQNNATYGGVYYVLEDASVNVNADNKYVDNNATDGGVFYNNGNIISTGSEYTKSVAEQGGVLYNTDGSNFTSSNDKFTSNTATDGAVTVNKGNVTINESTIDSNNGINSVIINENQLSMVKNAVSNNYVTSTDKTVINNTVATATIVDNTFVNNTDNERDMLLGGTKPQNITGNVYVDNYLNDTMTVPENIELALDETESYIVIPLYLNNIYNDTVRNGTVYFYDEDNNKVGEGTVVNGSANVRILRSELTNAITPVNVTYKSLSKHYQDMVAESTLHLSKLTAITIEPIDTLYVDDTVDVKVSLYEVDGFKPMYNANIIINIEGTDYLNYVANTNDKGYVILENVNFTKFGNYHMNATFNMNATHEMATINTTIEVIRIPTYLNMILPDNIRYPDDSGVINVTIYDSRNNQPIEGLGINLDITGKEYYSSVSDVNGNISYTFVADEHGNIEVVATGNLTDKYARPTRFDGKLFVERYHTHFHSNSTIPPDGGGEANTTFTLYDENHDLIKNKNVTVTIQNSTGTYEFNSTTDENGNITFTQYVPGGGDVNITVSCIEDYKYRYSSLPVHLIAGMEISWITVNPTNTYVNQTNEFQIILQGANGAITSDVTLTVGEFEPVTVHVENGNVTYTNDTWKWPETRNVNVSVEFSGNTSVSGVTANNTFTVFRIPTVTTVEILQNLNNATIIAGTVTNTFNESYPINTPGGLTLTAVWVNESGGEEMIVLDDSVDVIDGKYNLTTNQLTTTGVNQGRYNIIAKYNTNNVFFESSASTGTIRITTYKNTKISITNTPTILVGQDEGIVFSLRDENNELLINKTLNITINGTEYVDREVTTDQYGRVVIHTTFDEVGLNNITASFSGDTYYNVSSQISNITVKQKTITLLSVPSPVHVNENITFTITLKDIKGNPLEGQEIIVEDYLNQRTFVTDENGTVNVSVIYTQQGIKTITADFDGSTFYVDSNTTDIIQVLRLDTILNVTAKSPVYVENITKISGYLTLHNSTPIADATVLLYINGAEDAIRVTTNSSGYYYYDYPTVNVGRNNVKAVFETTDTYYGFEDTQVFIVKKYFTDVSVTADKLLKVGDSTEITGILEDEFGNPLANKIVNLTVNGEVVSHDTTDDDGSYAFTFTQHKSGIYNISVNFTGDNKYDKSHANYQIKVDKVITHIDISGNSPVNYGDWIIVDAVLFDEYGNKLSRQNITVYINGTEAVKTSSLGEGYIDYSYKADAIDLQNITFKFNGTDMYHESNNTYQVNVLKIYTHFVDLDALNVELGQYSTITGYLVDEAGRGLEGVEFKVTLNNNESTTKHITTGNNGHFSFEYNSTTIGLNNVTLNYSGNYSQEPVDDLITFAVDKLDVYLSVNDTKLKARSSVIILNVNDEDGNPLREGTVLTYYSMEGEPIGRGAVNENGLAEINLELEPGVHDVIVVYNGTEDKYKSANMPVTLNVPRYILNITLDTIKDIKVKNSTNITGKLYYENEENPISNGSVIIYVNDDEIATIKTGADGNFTYQYNALTSGFKEVVAVFVGNTTHSTVEAVSNFTVEKINTQVHIDTINNVTVGNRITVKGQVTDEFGLITSVTVNIEINNVNYTKTTDENGNFSYELTTGLIGENNVTVYFDENNMFNKSLNKIVFNVTKPNHVFNVIPDRVNPLKLGDTTEITGTIVNENNEPLADTEINVTVNGETRLVTTNSSGRYNYTYTANVTGTNNVTVSLESGAYEAFEHKYNFTVSKLFSVIDVTADSPIIVNDNTTIAGRLVDERNNPITGVNVSIFVNKVNVKNVTTGSDGNYSYNYTGRVVGFNNVTVSFEGNDNYTSINMSAYFNVERVFTSVNITTITPIKVGCNTTISGYLVDAEGEGIEGAVINITVVGGDNYNTTTVDDGYYSLNVTGTSVGNYKVEVFYNGSVVYIESSNVAKFIVEEHDSNVAFNHNDIVNGKLNVTVNVTDEEGNAIQGGFVNITDETGKVIGNGTVDENGTLTTNITLAPGKHNITVVYNGTDNSTKYTTTIVLDIPKYNAQLTLDDIDDTIVRSSTNITGFIRDETGSPIKNANITVTVDGMEIANLLTGADGKYNVVYNASTVGDKSAVVKFKGNDKYLQLDVNKTFKVSPVHTGVTVKDINDLTIGGKVTITGTLTDELNQVVANTEVVITINGKNYTTVTDKEGNYNYNYTAGTAGVNNVTVTFVGDNNILGTINRTRFNVNKETTNVSAEVILPKDGTSLIEVNVTDNRGNNVYDGIVEIRENGEIIATANVVNGTAKIPVPTEAGKTYEFEIVYNGTDVYGNASNVIKSTKIPDKSLSVIFEPVEPTTVGNTTNITGRIVDENNNPLANTIINITINNKTFPVKTDVNGTYNYPYTSNVSGTNIITVSYEQEGYNKLEYKYNFTIDKVATTIQFETPTTIKIGIPTTINGTLTNQNAQAVPNANITVKVGKDIINTSTDKNGKYSVTTTLTTIGTEDITVSYAGNDTYKATNNTGVLYVDKLDTTLSANVSSPIKVESTEKITGTLLDENNKPIRNANIKVTVNGNEYNTTTNSKGVYSVNYPTTTTGVNNVSVSFVGDSEHYPISTTRKFTVEKLDVVVDIAMPKVGAGSSNIVANLTDENGNKVSEGTVTITTPDGKQINAKVKDGKVNVTVPTTPGEQTYTITYNGGDDYAPITTIISENVPKVNTTIKVNKLASSEVDDTTIVKGTLKDSNGKALANTEVTVKYADTTKVVKTNSKGAFTTTIPDIRAGTNNVTVTYGGDDTYNPSSSNTTQIVNKHSTLVKVDEVSGIVGEKITLTAYVTDDEGNNVNGGNLVFKLNGKTLREDYRFDSNLTPLKFKVVDGKVSITITADLYLRSAKNLTASYSGSYKYEANASDIVTAQIKKRLAILNVTTVPTSVKQDSYVIFKAYLTDVTENAKNKTSLSTDGTVIFKVNGNTIKDENGSQIHVEVVNNIASYRYYVEPGTASVYKNGTLRNYSVEAVYNNPSFYPNTRNTTGYNVEKSDVNINFEKTTVKSNKLSIKATFTDYKGNALVGNNTVCVKINGKTYQENGEIKYFNIVNGKVNLSGIKLASGTKVNSVMIVTGERQSYHGARETTTDITS